MLCNSSWVIQIWFFLSKFSNFETNFVDIRFIHKTTEKKCKTYTNMPSSSETSLIVIRWLTNIIFVSAATFQTVTHVLGCLGQLKYFKILFKRVGLRPCISFSWANISIHNLVKALLSLIMCKCVLFCSAYWDW